MISGVAVKFFSRYPNHRITVVRAKEVVIGDERQIIPPVEVAFTAAAPGLGMVTIEPDDEHFERKIKAVMNDPKYGNYIWRDEDKKVKAADIEQQLEALQQQLKEAQEREALAAFLAGKGERPSPPVSNIAPDNQGADEPESQETPKRGWARLGELKREAASLGLKMGAHPTLQDLEESIAMAKRMPRSAT